MGWWGRHIPLRAGPWFFNQTLVDGHLDSYGAIVRSTSFYMHGVLFLKGKLAEVGFYSTCQGGVHCGGLELAGGGSNR